MRARTPFVSKFRDWPFDFDDDARRARYLELVAASGRSRAANVEAFFRATFDVWRNLRRSGEEAVYVGYSPALTVDAERVLADLPQSHFLHVVRNPWSAYADTKKRPVPLPLADYMLCWTINQYAALIAAERFPGRVSIVRAEDVMADPVATLGPVLALLGLGAGRKPRRAELERHAARPGLPLGHDPRGDARGEPCHRGRALARRAGRSRASAPALPRAASATTSSPRAPAGAERGPRRSLVTGAAGFVGAALVRRLPRTGMTCRRAPQPELRRRGDLPSCSASSALRRGRATRARMRRRARLPPTARPEWIFHLAAHGAYSWQTDRRRIVGYEPRRHDQRARGGGAREWLPAADRLRRLLVRVRRQGPRAERGRAARAEQRLRRREGGSDALRVLPRPRAATPGRDAPPLLGLRPVRGAGTARSRARRRRAARRLPAARLARRRPRLRLRRRRGRGAFVLAAGGTRLPPGAVLNVGSGVETTVEAAAQAARRVFGLAAEPVFGAMPGRAWDTPRWLADPRRIGELLQWRADISFERGLALTAAWLRERPRFWPRYGLGEPG